MAGKWASRRLAFAFSVFIGTCVMRALDLVPAESWTSITARVVEFYLGVRGVEHIAGAIASRREGGGS